MELAVQYELYDMIIGDLGNNPQQPVEEEYRAYVTTPLSKLPSLKFWEVCGNINGVNLLTRHGSSTRQPFQHYSYGDGLPAHPGFVRSLQTGLLIEC